MKNHVCESLINKIPDWLDTSSSTKLPNQVSLELKAGLLHLLRGALGACNSNGTSWGTNHQAENDRHGIQLPNSS